MFLQLSCEGDVWSPELFRGRAVGFFTSTLKLHNIGGEGEEERGPRGGRREREGSSPMGQRDRGEGGKEGRREGERGRGEGCDRKKGREEGFC